VHEKHKSITWMHQQYLQFRSHMFAALVSCWRVCEEQKQRIYELNMSSHSIIYQTDTFTGSRPALKHLRDASFPPRASLACKRCADITHTHTIASSSDCAPAFHHHFHWPSVSPIHSDLPISTYLLYMFMCRTDADPCPNIIETLKSPCGENSEYNVVYMWCF